MNKNEKKVVLILLPIVLSVIGYFCVGHFNLKERVSRLEGQFEVLSKIKTDVVKIRGDINNVKTEINTIKNLPSVSISDEIYDKMGKLIDNNNAPFEIVLKGTCSNTKDKFLYLVVEDENIQFVQPGLGINYDGPLEGHCYLGQKGNIKSLNKTYKVFAVVVNRSYQAHEVLNRGTIIIESQKISLKRVKK